MKKVELENHKKIKKFGKVYTVCYNGMNVHLTEVEAHAISGIPSFIIEYGNVIIYHFNSDILLNI